MEPAPQSPALPGRIVLYDGVCALCNWTVRFLLNHDPGDAFTFSALQGDTAERLKAEHPEIPREINTIVLVEDGVVWLRSAAIFRAAKQLPLPWSLIRVWWIVPRPLTDVAYNLMAATRYRVFGKYDHCPLPPPEQARKFLP